MPSVFFIGETGVPLEIVAGNVTVPELALKIDAVLGKSGKSPSGSSINFIQSEQKAAENASGSFTVTKTDSTSVMQGESSNINEENKAAEISHEVIKMMLVPQQNKIINTNVFSNLFFTFNRRR